MYGKTLYGRSQYAQEGSGSIVLEEYFVDLARYAPPFLAGIREMAEIYRTQGYEAGQLQHDLEELIEQCYIVTATWGMSRWEQMFGVATNMSLTYEQRREILMAKLRGQGTTTRKMIEDTPNHLFVIRFVGIKGIPRNMQAFITMLEDIKPAHLAYRFEYRYTIWREVKPYTWGQMRHMTWSEIRTLKEA